MEEASFDSVDLGSALFDDFKIGGETIAEDCEAKEKKLASRNLFCGLSGYVGSQSSMRLSVKLARLNGLGPAYAAQIIEGVLISEGAGGFDLNER